MTFLVRVWSRNSVAFLTSDKKCFPLFFTKIKDYKYILKVFIIARLNYVIYIFCA